jgi:hypothetical protein
MANIPEELRDSTERILAYADIDEKQADLFRRGLDVFRRTKNQLSLDAEARRMRETATAIFFEIYTAVLKRVVKEANPDKLYQLFLRCGFMDEKLLEPEQITELYELLDQSCTNETTAVYEIKNWLEKIYRQEREPSINQFGKDYYDVFREMKKRGEVTDKDKAAYDNDLEARLNHETENLFKIGQRLCFGRMSGYFPVLNSEKVNDLSEALVTPSKIEASLAKILAVDYSVFHREVVYNNKDHGISKELVMKPVRPEFILIPTLGERAVMWQELTGRVSASAGRIIFPLFTFEDLDNMMVETAAHFRWELSKTMASRSNSEESSLYSDYIDYLQFYKKNRELSEEARARIKAQMERCRNNMASMFAADYKTWITFESNGILRLNKVARSIMFKHCPFSKPIREQLQRQPLYNPLITKYDTIMEKQAKALTARYTKLIKSGTPFDINLIQNLHYYRA